MNPNFTFLLTGRKPSRAFLVISLFLFVLLKSGTGLAQTFTHPGAPFTNADLAQLKANITREPWRSAYNQLKGIGQDLLFNYQMPLPTALVSRAPASNNTQWIKDMKAIHNLTFMYVFTGDSAYARKATNMLDSWAVINTVWGGNESMLDIGDMAPYFVPAADILRSTFPGWTAANSAHVANYFANVLYPTSFVPGALRDHNKGAIQLQIAIGIAAYLGDPVKWQQAIEVYRMDAGGGLRNSLPNGEVGDSGRDDHWWVQIAALGWSAEVAWKQGIDLFAELDNRVLAMAELYHHYGIAPQGLNFIPFGGYSAFYTNWGIPPGFQRRGPFNNIVQGAYALRKGIPTPYTTQMRGIVGEDAWSFLYLKSADSSTATPLTPIVYPADLAQPAAQLTNIDIGNTGVSGSLSVNNGTWTVKGAGNSSQSSCNFTFKKVKGDAGIIVKVTGNTLSTAGAGVMLRESLATNSRYVNINLAAAGGISSTHYQPKTPWWLKLERVGNRIFTYHSPDGINWTNLALNISNYSADTYIGFYTVANNLSAVNTASFTNVAFTNTEPAGAPVISSQLLATAQTGADFNYTIQADNAPVIFRAKDLPSGLSIDSLSGTISGRPLAAGKSVVALQAVNAQGTGTATLVISINSNLAPVAPVAAAAVSNTTRINLTWAAVPNASTYTVKRALAATGPFTVIQNGITLTSYLDADPEPEVTNYYIVTAVAGALESAGSNVVSAAVPPEIPAKPAIAFNNNQLVLSWPAVPAVQSYKVKRAMVSGGPYTLIATVPVSTYTDNNVSNGRPYYYVVSAVGAAQESGESPEAFGVPGGSASNWAPAAVSDSLNLAANWLENRLPVNPATLTFGSSQDSVLTNDIAGLQASRIVFEANASAYTIDGNPIILKNDLISSNAGLQTLSMPVTIDTLLHINTINGAGTIALTGVVSGTGTLMKTGLGFLNLKGANTYSGNTIINGTSGGWPPRNAINIAGTGTGASSLPLTGALGTGKVIMNGGALNTNQDATIYNDLVATAGKRSYLYQNTGAMHLRGKITGSGELEENGNTTAGLHLWGDNSGFTGTFRAVFRSGNQRLRFEVPESGSAKAFWLLDANSTDCQSIQFGIGTLHLGGLAGRGAFRNNGGGSPIISIGALNVLSKFDGAFSNFLNIEKVGTANLIFTGNHTYWGTTKIKKGKFLLNNDPNVGTFASPVIVEDGAFGGSGRSTASATIGTGTGPGAILEPGNETVGALKVSALVMNADATYAAELNLNNAAGDKLIAGSVALVNQPKLLVTAVSGSPAPGISFTIIDNTGTAPVQGEFKDLPELALVTVSGQSFRITYKGGSGNDILLLDDRTISLTINSILADTAAINKPFTYNLTATQSPSRFAATGLPEGLLLNPANGVVSGTPTEFGDFQVTLIAANETEADTALLALHVKSDIVGSVIAAASDGRNIIEWTALEHVTYQLKRSLTPGGPYTTITQTAGNTYTDVNVTNGTRYYYVVLAVDSLGERGKSMEAVATPAAGQVGKWEFDEAEGIRAIDSWGAKHGVLRQDAGRNAGRFGRALKLDGTAESYAVLPNGIVSSLNDFTISAWVRMDQLSTWMRVFDFGSGSTKYMFLSVQAGLSGTQSIVRYAIKNGSGAEQSLSYNYTFPLNTQTRFTITRAGNLTTLYINGAPVASTTAISIKPSALEVTTQNYLGKSQFTADPMFKGSIDDVKILNRALTPAEVAADIQGEQTIIFNSLNTKKFGAADFIPPAMVNSGLPITFTSSDTAVAVIAQDKIQLKGPGTAIITASQDGNTIYRPASPVTQLLTVNKALQTITFNSLAEKTWGDPDFAVPASVTSGLSLVFSSTDTTVAKVINGHVHITGTGSTRITASQAGNTLYETAIPVMQTLTVNKKIQTITFDGLSSKKLGDPDFTLAATASSGLPVIFESDNIGVLTISGHTAHITGPGTVSVTARQSGNAFYKDTLVTRVMVISPFNLKLLYADGDNAQVGNNNIKPKFKLLNQDSVAVPYEQLTVRYWFTPENYAGINTWIDYAQLGNAKITAKYVALTIPAADALGYVEFGFKATAGSLLPNSNSGNIETRFANTDWANLAETNDYSYTAGTGFSENAKITVYRNGSLVWGNEPGAVTAQRTLKILEENRTAAGNTINVNLRMENQGNVPVDYKALSIRYFFSNEGLKPLSYWVDYAKLGNAKIKGQFISMSPAATHADTYLEIRIDSTAGKLYPSSSTGDVQFRIAKTDWSAFNQTNDHSFKSGALSENQQIGVYYNGDLIYGNEPASAQRAMFAVASGNTGPAENPVLTISTYPNPVTDNQFTISTTGAILNGPVLVRITNLYGKQVYAKTIVKNGDTINVQLGTRLETGIYILQLNNRHTVKVIFQ